VIRRISTDRRACRYQLQRCRQTGSYRSHHHPVGTMRRLASLARFPRRGIETNPELPYPYLLLTYLGLMTASRMKHYAPPRPPTIWLTARGDELG
jgi:hypothetical protein